MNWRSASLMMAALLVAGTAPAGAQQRLGDFVAQGGYDWMIGRWAATTDEGQRLEFTYDWALDKHVVLSDLAVGSFKLHGMIMLTPASEDVFDVSVDNMGGTAKGTWSEGSDGLVHKMAHTGPDGTVREGEIVHSRVDADTMTVAMYGVDASGNRNTEAWGKLTYKRQAAKTPAESAATAPSSRAADYQKLGDLVAEGGYEWLFGKWTATDESRTYEVEYKAILDQHAALTDVKIGDFAYRGLILYTPSRQEITQIGADNLGGVWKGTWEDSDEGALNKIDYTKPDGTTQKLQHVYVRAENNVLKIKQYRVEAGGATQPQGELIFQRAKAATESK